MERHGELGPWETQLLQAAEESQEAVAIASPEGRFVYTNPAYDALHGYDEGELAGQPVARVLAECATPEELTHGLEPTEVADAWEGEVRNVAKDGTLFTSHALLTRIYDSSGRTKSWAISKHPLRQQGVDGGRMARAHSEIARLADLVPGFFYRCWNDRQWTMQEIWGEVEAITGYSRQELVGNAAMAFADLIHPEDRDQVWTQIQTILRQGKPFWVQYRLVDRAGSVREVWEKGQYGGQDAAGHELVEGYVADITSQQEARRAQEESEEKYRRLFNSLNDAAFVFEVGDDGTPGYFEEVNELACRMLGYSRAELGRLTLDDIESQNMRDRRRELLAEIRSQGSFVEEGEHVARDGTLVPVEISAYAMPSQGAVKVVALARDIRKIKARNRMLERSQRALGVLTRINQALLRADTATNLLQKAVEGIALEADISLVWAGYLGTGQQPRLEEVFAAGQDQDLVAAPELNEAGPAGPVGGLLAAVVEAGETQTRNLEADSETDPWLRALEGRGYRSLAVLPLQVEGRIFGLLGLLAQEPSAFDHPGEIEVMNEAASDLAFGLQALETSQSLEARRQERDQALYDTVLATARVLDERDPYTAGHQERVARVSAAIAERLGHDSYFIEGLRLGALIHDIGKVKIPTDILNKPGKLSRAEFEIIKEHPEAGDRILGDVAFPWPVRSMVRHHHERLDGSGYPDGVQEADLEAETKILAVADVVEAVTSHRPYRPGLGLDKARQILLADRADKLDAAAVDAGVALIDEGEMAALLGLDSA
jgi:PAS domain S-box-containing protein